MNTDSAGDPKAGWWRLSAAEIAWFPGGRLVYATERLLAPSAGTSAFLEAVRDIGPQIVLPVAGFVVRTQEAVVVVDAGAPEQLGGGEVAARLHQLGVDARDVSTVVLTHLHVDHVGGLVDATTRRPVFPAARHVCHSDDLSWHRAVGGQRTDAAAAVAAIEELLEPMYGPRLAIAPGVTLLLRSGHTPGHITVELGVDAAAPEAVIAADLVHLVHQLRTPDLTTFADVDPGRQIRQRRQLLDRLTEETLVGATHLPGHLGRLVREDGQPEWRPLDAEFR